MRDYMSKRMRKHFRILFTVARKSRERIYIIVGKRNPKWLVRKWYRQLFHTDINLTAPSNIDEKINWMKFHADMSLWTRCTDKYEVRKYVEEKGLGFTLNEMYGVYASPSEIDYDKLPSEFVIKTTNGGGGNNVMIVKDKSSLNKKNVSRILEKWLRSEDFYIQYEPHYINIPPRIIVEKYLHPKNGECALVDYKLNCFNGNVQNVLLCTERGKGEHPCLSVYDLDWNVIDKYILPDFKADKLYDRPNSLAQMIEYSKILSQGIPYVRVDWYEVDGKPIFGELTFTPTGGFHLRHGDDYRNDMGKLIDLRLVQTNI